MSVRELIIDPAEIDCSQIVADVNAIRSINPQRGPMEQLTAVVLDNPVRHLCVGYKDIAEDEFWVGGHMPGMPIMPGVLMCEAAAQVFSYHINRHDLSGAQMLGFGGLDKVRFRGVVKPGDRLVIACQLTKLRRGRAMHCSFQGFVGANLICEGRLVGVPLPVDALQSNSESLPRSMTSRNSAPR
jgi:3-hydroxyacyl-[acyl-carrier-protein] dehydratase